MSPVTAENKFKNIIIQKIYFILVFVFVLEILLFYTGGKLVYASGNTYYVGKNGKDSNNGTQATTPWLTIQHAADMAKAGDTVHVMEGTYKEVIIIKNSGALGSPIKFKNYNQDTVTIDGNGVKIPQGPSGGSLNKYGLIQIFGKNYIEIDGFNFSYSDGSGIMISDDGNLATKTNKYASNNITIKNNKFKGYFYFGAIRTGNDCYCNNINIENNIIESSTSDPDEDIEQISLSGISNFTVTNNNITGTGINPMIGICIKDISDNGNIYNNYINMDYKKNKSGDGIYLEGVTNMKVYNNEISRVESGINLENESGTGTVGTNIENVNIYNNKIYGNRVGIWMAAYGIGTFKNIKVQNNTVVNNEDAGLAAAYSKDSGFSGVDGFYIRNNIFYGGIEGAAVINTAKVKNFDFIYNIYNQGKILPSGQNNVNTNPNFIDLSKNDFHLKADSLAIDKGINMDSPLLDIEGKKRPQGNGIDIGAYEYGQISNPSPTNIVTPTPDLRLSIAPTSSIPTTKLILIVYEHGIGNSGDNLNPSKFSTSNKNPQHKIIAARVQLSDKNDQVVGKGEGVLFYSTDKGGYLGIIEILPRTLPTGEYFVKIKTNGHKEEKVQGLIKVTALTENIVPEVTLAAGDLNDDNNLNILDFNIILNCYSDLMPAVSCDANQKTIADLNDDSYVNEIDYNLFLRELVVKASDNNSLNP